jgi:tRNA (adenine22-N1)-methyltransferase
MIQLSKRLAAIAAKVEQGSRLADIGSDHALLPAFLAKEGRIRQAVAGELNPGPLEAARKQIAASGLSGIVSVRSGNGLEVIAAGEADTITIAGMGGALIADILEAGCKAGKLTGVRRLILQPNVGEEFVRRWLRGNGWFLLGEEMLEEDGKIYEILWASPVEEAELPAVEEAALYADTRLDGFGAVLQADWLRYGPYLLRDAAPVFIEKWKKETGKLERVARSLENSGLEESRVKRLAVVDEINRLKELIACLQKGKPLFN